MKTNEINIRDPYVLVADNTYYLYGTRSLTCWSDGSLLTLLSSWSSNQYAVGMVKSRTGNIRGPWEHIDLPLWKENGGHGMVFQTLDGKIMFTLHYPNDFYNVKTAALKQPFY